MQKVRVMRSDLFVIKTATYHAEISLLAVL